MLNFEILFNTAPDAYLVLNPNLVVIAATDAYLELAAMTRADMLDRAIFTLFPFNGSVPGPSGLSPLETSLLRVKQTGVADTLGVLHFEDTSPTTKDQHSVRYWNILNTPVFDAQKTLTALILRAKDVTDFVRARLPADANPSDVNATAILDDSDVEMFIRSQSLEEGNQRLRTANLDLMARESEMRQLNAELEKRVADRTADLVKVNKELEAFNYSVSHDLRTPLRALDGFSQAILEDYADRLDADGRRYLERIRAASQRMSYLIDDLLRLSRISRRELQVSTVDLSALAREITADLQNANPARNATVTIQPDIRASGDKGLLQIVMQNLLDNAWKFSSKNPAARIEFGIQADEPTPIYFVRDNGVGFDMAYANKLFIAFQRLHTTDEFEGTGIGLVTVQRIIHRHGGRIWVESAVDQGATFYFTLSS
jgi:signal transduction histidine kinase